MYCRGEAINCECVILRAHRLPLIILPHTLSGKAGSLRRPEHTIFSRYIMPWLHLNQPQQVSTKGRENQVSRKQLSCIMTEKHKEKYLAENLCQSSASPWLYFGKPVLFLWRMSQVPGSDIYGNCLYVLGSEYPPGGWQCCSGGRIVHAGLMFPPKFMHVFLSFVMGAARSICRCRSLETKLTRQAVGQGTKGRKWHRCTEIIIAALVYTS